MSDFQHITGDFVSVTITPDSPKVLGLNAISGMAMALRLSADDVIEIETSGTCMLELEDGTRILATMKSGKIRGPALLSQVGDVPVSLIQKEAKRLARLARSEAILAILAKSVMPFISLAAGLAVLAFCLTTLGFAVTPILAATANLVLGVRLLLRADGHAHWVYMRYLDQAISGSMRKVRPLLSRLRRTATA